MSTYSFTKVFGTISGPGGSFNIGSGSGVSENGITITSAEDRNVVTQGASGVENTLVAGSVSQLTIELLKTSATNARLYNMYASQIADAAFWGINVVTLRDTLVGTTFILNNVAFKALPENLNQKNTSPVVWMFDAAETIVQASNGLPTIPALTNLF